MLTFRFVHGRMRTQRVRSNAFQVLGANLAEQRHVLPDVGGA